MRCYIYNVVYITRLIPLLTFTYCVYCIVVKFTYFFSSSPSFYRQTKKTPPPRPLMAHALIAVSWAIPTNKIPRIYGSFSG